MAACILTSSCLASGFPGGLTDISAAELWERDPTRLLSWAIYGMLPRNRARKYRMLKLKLFPEEKHPFGDFELLPLEMPYRAPQDKRYGWLLPDGFLPVNKRLYAYRTMTSKLKWETQKPVVDFSDLLMEDERRALGLSARGGSAGNGAEPQVLNLSKRAAAAAAADGESFGGSS